MIQEKRCNIQEGTISKGNDKHVEYFWEEEDGHVKAIKIVPNWGT